jgi:hypothetical protein
MDTDDVIDAAGREADRLYQIMAEGGKDLEPAFRALEEQIRAFETESGQDASVLLPAQDDAGLRFLRNRNGENFWGAYEKRLRKQLCAPRGELRKLFRHGSQVSGSSLVTAVVAALKLPIELIALFGPIVAILMTVGLDAFCDAGAEPEHGAG